MKRDQTARANFAHQAFGWSICLGLVLTGWLWTQHRLDTVRTAAEIAAAPRREEIQRLQAEKTAALSTRVENDSALPPAPRVAESAPPVPAEALRSQAMANLTTLIQNHYIQVAPQRRLGTDIPPDVLSPDSTGSFPPDFARLFNLSDADFGLLQASMAAMKQRIESALVENTTVQRDPSGAIVMTTSALPKAAEMKEDFRQLLQGTLGAENFGVFMALRSTVQSPNLQGIDSFFSSFGSEPRRTTIPKNERGYGLPVVGNDPPAAVRFSITTREYVVKNLGPLAPLLPADF